ncbi:TPA: glycosyltransferase family 2 protein, partial [Legionella pneumophila]
KVLIPVNARVGKLKKPIWHHSFSDVHHVLYKLNKYSSYSAKIRIESNEKVGLVKTFFSALWMFVRCLFLQKGFLDGRAGFLFAVFGAQGAFYRGVKQIYKDRDINKLPSVNHIKEE